MAYSHQPHWRIWVDWNDNGIWGEREENYWEDVTGDVLELGWKWGRPPDSAGKSGRPDPTNSALLDFTLRNDGRRYSPGNAASPLAGNLNAGRRVWAAFAYPYDDFAGTDGTDLKGRAPTVGRGVGSGLAWVKDSGEAGSLVLEDGEARPVAGSGGAIYTLDFGVADAHVGFHYRRSGHKASNGASNGASGVALRFINQWDYLRVRFGGTATVLEDVTFGYASTLRRGDPLAANVNYFIEIELHGNSVRLYATDLDAGVMDRRQILDGGGNAANLSATRHGIWHDGLAAAAADRYAGFGGWRSFFHGPLTNISPEREPELGEVCRCQARDDLARLGQRSLYNLLHRRNLSSGDIANSILTWSGFDPNLRRLEGGQVLVATEPRALWGLTAGGALRSLATEEGGQIYMDGRGYFRLESATHRRGGAHLGARGTLRDSSGAGPYFSDLAWDEGAEAVENSVTYRYQLGENAGLQEVWRLRDVAAIPAGESRDFLAESSSFDVVDSIRVPSATVDYRANGRPDGTGDDLTASVAVSLPFAATHRGRGTAVRVENRHASATAYVTLLRLKADRTYRPADATSYRAENAASQARHGLRTSVVNCRFIDNFQAARAGAEARLAQKGEARARLALTLPQAGGANLAQVVHRVLSDRVRVACDNPAIDGDFFIEGMEVRAVARSGQLEARWLVEGA